MFGTPGFRGVPVPVPALPSPVVLLICIDHSTQTSLWGCTGSQCIVVLFFKNWRFISLFLWFDFFFNFFFLPKVGHCAIRFGAAVAHLFHGGEPWRLNPQASGRHWFNKLLAKIIKLQPQGGWQHQENKGRALNQFSPIYWKFVYLDFCRRVGVNTKNHKVSNRWTHQQCAHQHRMATPWVLLFRPQQSCAIFLSFSPHSESKNYFYSSAALCFSQTIL